MSNYIWDAEKNTLLQEKRDLGFADIVTAIDEGGLIDDVEHPNADRPNQRIMYVVFNEHVVAVPYVPSGDSMFLKTAFYDRKAKRKYLNR